MRKRSGPARRGATAVALAGAIATAVVAGGCEGREPTAASGSRDGGGPSPLAVAGSGAGVVEIDLSRGLPEVVPAGLFGPPNRKTHVDFVRAMRAMRDDDAASGAFVRLGGSGVPLARAQEVGRLLGEIRAKGKPVVCHADDYDNGTLALAALGCSKVWLSPAGSVDAVGLAAQLVFASKLLESLHVGVDFLQVGKFKGASEPFTRDGPSPEARASLEGALRGLRAAWLADLAGARGQAVADAAEDGPYSAAEAKEKKLVDEVGYPDEARDDAKKLAKTEQIAVRFGGLSDPEPMSRGVVDVFRAIAGASAGGAPHVAVVRAVGAITMAGGGPFGGDGITERDLGKTIARLTKNKATKAVVLRIDSPGGSALASDLLWRKLMKLRAEKPLVVSVGTMAASGGYYLACAGSKIVAEPTSILGSIGVVGGKLALGESLERIGVHTETIAAAPDPVKAARAAYMSPMTRWDEATRARMLASMTAIYDLFVNRVAEGRALPVEKVGEFAEGRLFAGIEAKERGMIDELGGLDEAIDWALELAKLPDDAPVDVVGETPGLIELLEEGGDPTSGGADTERRLALAARAAAERALAAEWGGEELAPAIGGFVGSMSALAAGERTAAALPFVLLVR